MRHIEILGTGCPKCRELAARSETAARAMGIEYEIVKVTDLNAIVGYGVMLTPALVVDGVVKVVGKVPSVDDIAAMLRG